MPQNGHETEIKLSLANAADARRLLRDAGFRLAKRRVFESNTIFDTPGQELRRASQLLRLRQAGRNFTITYKGRPMISKHKSREELELKIGDLQAMAAIFERL